MRRVTVLLPGRMKLALVFRVGVTVNGDDANRRAGRVRDDDWLGQHGAGAGRSHAAAADVRRRGDAPAIKTNSAASLTLKLFWYRGQTNVYL